ncbi:MULTISPECIES: cytochrome P450 [unclassified Streptomyces]|uniref:cytochrome P450 n=1 Tax=unclassified Streptomyces TaxID=2593676 RepID=UPI0038655E0E
MTAPAHRAESAESGSTPPLGCPAHANGTNIAVPLYGPEFAADPESTYALLRRYGPAAPVELAPGVRATLVTSYNTALKVLRTPQIFSKDSRRWRAKANGEIPPDSPVAPLMSFRPNARHVDGREHSRLRSVITDSMDRLDPHALRHYVERSADSLIDGFAENGEADLMGQYAKVLPLLVFEKLFGCPADIGDRLVRGMTGLFDGVDAAAANKLLRQAAMDLITLKREHPGADVASWMLAHPAQLTDEEVAHQLALALGAGTEPEQNLIANALRLLLSDDRFAGDLAGGSLPVEDALDEVLWTTYTPLANFSVHFPVRDTVLDGAQLHEGDPVVISYAAANTDPVLPTGVRAGNRAHLSWSAGPHTCPAKGPARLIATVAIEKLLDRLPDLELAVPVEELVWRPGPFHRALAALPVRFPPTTVTIRNADTRGAQSWTGNAPVPSESTPQEATSTVNRSSSAVSVPRRGWSFRTAWRHGR